MKKVNTAEVNTVIAKTSTNKFDSILDAIRVPYQGSDFVGSKIFHGTIDKHLDSILAGIQNIGRGAGGKAFYVAINDQHLAWEYAGFAKKSPADKMIVLEGYLKPDCNLRVARIEIAKRFPIVQANLEKGIFPPDWSKNLELQQFMHEHFDVIQVTNAKTAGLNINSDNFLVIHESAGDAIIWNKAHISSNGIGSASQSVALPSKPVKEIPNIQIKSQSNKTLFYTQLRNQPIGKVVKGLVWKMLPPGLFALDFFNNFEHAKEQYSEHSVTGQVLATATGVCMDAAASFILGAGTGGGMMVVGALLPMLAELAPHLKDVSPESLQGNREVFEGLLDYYDISESAKEILLQDFDKDGQKSKEFLTSSVLVIKQVFKPLERYAEMKHQAMDRACAMGDSLSSPAINSKVTEFANLAHVKAKEQINAQINSGHYSQTIVNNITQNSEPNVMANKTPERQEAPSEQRDSVETIGAAIKKENEKLDEAKVLTTNLRHQMEQKLNDRNFLFQKLLQSEWQWQMLYFNSPI